MEILDFLPDNLRQQLRDSAVEFLADYAEKIVGEKTAKTIRLLLLKQNLTNLSITPWKLLLNVLLPRYDTR